MKESSSLRDRISFFLINWGFASGGWINIILGGLFVYATGNRSLEFYKDFRIWVVLLLMLSIGITFSYELEHCNHTKLSTLYIIISTVITIFFVIYSVFHLYFAKEVWTVIDILCACFMGFALIYKTIIALRFKQE